MNGLARTWRPLATTALMVFIPVGFITLFVFQSMGATDFLEVVFNNPELLSGLSNEELFELARPFFEAALIAVGIQLLAGAYIHLAVHRIVAADISGVSVSGPDARRHALRRLPRLLVAGLIALVVTGAILSLGLLVWSIPFGDPSNALAGCGSAIAAFLFLIACVAPAVWIGTGFSMTAPVLALEDAGSVRALRRSFELVRNRWFPTLGYLIVVGLFGSVSVQLIQLIAIPLATVGNIGMGVSLASALGIAAQGLIIAGIGAMWTAWYVDLRSRVETLATDDLP
jgi:hypothetical protein